MLLHEAVGKAYSVLSDAEKRERYDLYGHEGVNTTQRRRRDSSDDEFEQQDFDPQELFNMFFGGGYPSGLAPVLYHCVACGL